ncbi:hypothetical protein TNCV_2973341 [Trichonephila clavipes]|nr:hypothetical protein TNCV_2973341 [Trichonephila clavipes]
MMDKSILKQVKEILESAYVCTRCILRFFCVKEYTSYISKTDIEKSIKLLVDEQSDDADETQISQEDSSNDCPSAKRFSPNPCPSCLGILQGVCDEMPSKVTFAHESHDFFPF